MKTNELSNGKFIIEKSTVSDFMQAMNFDVDEIEEVESYIIQGEYPMVFTSTDERGQHIALTTDGGGQYWNILHNETNQELINETLAELKKHIIEVL